MAKEPYNILDLMKFNLQELQNIALWHGIDITNKGKQTLIYDILNKQSA
jgi:hypothetical protein